MQAGTVVTGGIVVRVLLQQPAVLGVGVVQAAAILQYHGKIEADLGGVLMVKALPEHLFGLGMTAQPGQQGTQGGSSAGVGRIKLQGLGEVRHGLRNFLQGVGTDAEQEFLLGMLKRMGQQAIPRLPWLTLLQQGQGLLPSGSYGHFFSSAAAPWMMVLAQLSLTS